MILNASMKRFIGSIIIILITAMMFSCGKNEPVKKNEPAKRTILVYMIAANNLGTLGYDSIDLAEMETAISKYGTNGCRFLVFRVSNSAPVTLFEFTEDANGRVNRKILKTYNNKLPATSIKRMAEVFGDMLLLAPANEYGLILWSHASGWAVNLPKNPIMLKSKRENLVIRNFGMDGRSEMRLDELEQAIPAGIFDFVYTDACYMGAIEVAYQLRNKVNYLIASPTIILGEGMPYHLNVLEFSADEVDYKKICENTYRYYNSKSGEWQSCTISLTDCTKLDALAAVSKHIYSNTTELNDISGIQNYIAPSDGKCIFFDFGQYMQERLKQSMNEAELLDVFKDALKDVVLYKQSTNKIYNELVINKTNYSGLSVYIEGTGGDDNDDYYHTTDWYKATQKF